MMLGDMAAAAGDSIGGKLAPAGLGFITLIFGIGQVPGACGRRVAQGHNRNLCVGLYPLCRGLAIGRRRLHAAQKESSKTLFEVGVKGEFWVPAAAFQVHPSSFRPLHPYFQSKAVFGKKY